MPTIPTYDSQLTGVTGAGRLESPMTAAATATQELGKTLVDIGKKFKRAEEVSQYNENMKNLQEDLTNLHFSYAERPDFQNFRTDFEKDAENLRKKYAENMSNNSLWGQFESRMNGAIVGTEVSVRTDARKKQVQQGKATYLSGMTSLSDMYGKSSDTEKNHILTQASELTQMNVDAGYITPIEGQEILKKFKYDSLKSDVWYTARGMGYEEGIKWLQNEKNTPELSRSDRNSMIAELRRDWNIEKVEKREKEKKLNNLTYQAFLEKLVSWEKGEGDLPSSAEIVNSPITDPGMKQQIMSYIDSVGRSKNPFLTSDPKMFGDVMSGIVIHPENYSKSDIQKLMGKGLSSADTLEALKLYDRVTTLPEPKKNSKLALATKMLNRAANEGMFVGKDLKTEATDEEIINNYAMHAKALTELYNRAQEGDDPIEVAKELMKPIVDRKVEAWFDKLWNFTFHHKEYTEKEYREQAIQELQEEGELVTEATIQERVKQIQKGESE